MQYTRSMVALSMLAGACGTLDSGDEAELGEAASSSPLALQWSVAELGPGNEVAMSLDRAGNPALAIRRGLPVPEQTDADTTPVFISNDGRWRLGTGWQRTDIAPIAGMVDGAATSVAFGQTAQVAFNSRVRLDQNSGMTLKLATQSASGWQVSTVESTPWVWQLSQQVDAGTGTTFLGYTYTAQTGVVVARSSIFGSGGWTKVALTHVPRDLLTSTEIAIVPADPVTKADTVVGLVTTTLTAAGSNPRGLHYTSSLDGGANWRAVAHVDSSGAAIGPMIAFAGKNPVLSYSIVDAHHAKLATSPDGGATWQVETIGTFETTPSTGLAIAANGEPLVVLMVANETLSRSELYLARRDKTTARWSLELIDTINWSTFMRFAVNPRIAVTADRRVVIGYQYSGFDTSFVRFAWSSPL